jgi:hypothetical protein
MENQKATAADLTADIFTIFEKWINQRAGLDPRNYFSDWRDREGRHAYQQEARSIQKDGKRARTALELARMYPFNAQALIEATGAFSGRLQILARCTDCQHEETHEIHHYQGPALAGWNPHLFHLKIELDYCTGQYWPTEYRAAAATVLERYVEMIRPKFTPEGRIPSTITELKAMNKAAGSHFFDRGAMRSFRSRVVPTIYSGPGGVYFVTSEANSDDGERLFTVRIFDPAEGDINTFGEFRRWTRGAALGIARRAAAANPRLCHTCGGEGVKYEKECWHCNGTKLEPTREKAAA